MFVWEGVAVGGFWYLGFVAGWIVGDGAPLRGFEVCGRSYYACGADADPETWVVVCVMGR